MDWEGDLSESSTDEREARFVESARLISQLQAGLVEDLEWFDTAQVFNADGARSLSEWVAQKLDVSADTARGLVRTMRRTQNKPHLREALAAGAASFDRVEALSRIEDEKDLQQHLDIAGVDFFPHLGEVGPGPGGPGVEGGRKASSRPFLKGLIAPSGDS